MHFTVKQKFSEELLKNIKDNLPKLEELQKKIGESDDEIYRFYHYSFKVYWIQEHTKQIVDLLKSLVPEGLAEEVKKQEHLGATLFNSLFEEIYKEGTGKEFQHEHNQDWLKHTRPMVEAFMHANFFLKMAIKCGKEMETAPNLLPSHWAALLYFYNLR